MTPDPARLPGTFVMPAWWRDPAFSVREIAEFCDVPTVTVEHWLGIARIAGMPLGRKRGGRRFYSCHETYLIALLAKLRAIRFPVTDRVIASAYAFTHDEDGRPVAPGHIETWNVLGTADATLHVPAFACWTATRAFAVPHFGTTHA